MSKLTWTIVIRKQAVKNLQKIPNIYKKRIIAQINELEINPYLGLKLTGVLSNYYKIKIWPYRIIYELREKEKIIFVKEIAHRQGVYK